MKKFVIFILMAALMPTALFAQSTMTDDQVLQFVMREHKAGTSEQQMITKLMQNGVDIQQIRRVKQKYERQINDQGLGVVADEAVKRAENRMRVNNAPENYDNDNFVVKRTGDYRHTYDENDPEYLQMLEEFKVFNVKDSATMIRELMKERKKVFGRDIFNNKNLTFEPVMNIATPQDYHIGPGDAVIIEVYGASQRTITETVSPEGEVTISGFGPVYLSGLTVSQANAKLRSALGPRYSSSKIKLSVGQTRTITVNVMGDVNVPGTYTLSAFATVFNALYMAGGINDLGTLRDIKVYRQSRLISSVDIYDYILNGDLKGNVRLADGDVIQVGTYDCLVNIAGKVKRPMYYEMKRDESLGTLLKYAGGFTGDAYRKAVRVIRKTGREYSIFNVGEFEMNDFRIADGDSVTVDSVLPRFENMVEIKGAVFRPGMYQVGGNINSVRTLVEHAEGLTEEAFTNRAVMHRMKDDRSLEAMSVDIGGIMNGTVADIPLKKNDVLFIPTKQELQQERTITIHGQVYAPGVYRYAENETLEDFILQAGGLLESASTVKVDIARRVVDPKATQMDSLIANTYSLTLKEGFVIDGEPGFVLMPYDEVYVRRSPGFNVQQNVRVEGNVMFAGTYTLSSKDERVSDVIKKAGGVTPFAYVKGARIERLMNADERARRQEILRMIKTQNTGSDSIDINKLELSDYYAVGIDMEQALKHPGCDDDIVLRQGDHIIIPEYNGTVKISGDVMFPNTVVYEKGKRPAYYINEAGGFGNRAKKSHTYIIYMNGKVARVGHNTKVMPGCEIVVPSKPKRDGMKLAEWLPIGTSVASLGTVIASLVNLIK